MISIGGRAATLLAIALLLALGGCSTHRVELAYLKDSEAPQQPTTEVAEVDIRVGNFRDQRDAGTDWLGAIRGGYGNPLKKLRTTTPMDDQVESVFRQALEARGLLADSPEAANYELRVMIRKLDTSYYWNREAHAHLGMQLVHISTDNIVFRQSVREDREEPGAGAGIFGSVEHLRAFAEETLNIAVNQLLDDPALASGIQSSLESAQPATANSAEDRLKQIERLHDKGLLSNEEYRTKRDAIVENL